MRNRIVSCLVLSSVVLLVPLLPPSFAGVAEQLRQAEQLQKEGRFTEAEAIYKQIIVTDPHGDYGFAAEKGLAILYVDWGKDDLADQSYKRLLADFPQHPEIAKAVTNIADAYRAKEKHTKALEIYQYVIATWPKDEHALWSQMGSAISYACMGDPEAYDAAVQKLCDDFAGHKHLARAICIIADNWRKLLDFQKARALYEFALVSHPDLEFQLWSRMGLAISLVRVGQTKAAEQTIDRLLADFAQDQRISVAACLAADQFRALGKHQKACQLYNFVVDKWPKSEHALWSQMGLAVSNMVLGQENAAQEAVANLCTDFARDGRVPIAACTIADEYRKAGKYAKACEVYQYVVTDWPGDGLALWCQAGVAMCSLWLGNDMAAQVASENLLARFSTDERVAVAACLLGDEYRKMERHGQACELYQFVVDKWPDSEHALWSQMGLVISNIRLGNDPAAQDAVQRFISQFCTNRNFTQAIQQIVQEYRLLGRYDQADQIHKYVTSILNNQPNDTLWTRTAKLVSSIGLANDRDIESQIDRLVADFAQDPSLPEALWATAAEYYDLAFRYEKEGLDAKAKDYLAKVITTGQGILNQWPDSAAAPEICYISGICCGRLGEYAKAIEYYQKLVNEWPDYEHVWKAQFRIAKMSKWLILTGAKSYSEAEVAMKIAYEQFLARYTDCPAAEGARKWLEGNIKSTEGGQK